MYNRHNIWFHRSKTDQRGVGDHVRVLNHADSTICPVRLTRLYLDKLGYQQGVMLPSLRGKIPNPKVAITYKTALRDLKNTLISIGVDPTGFGEHSGRRGGTTAAAAAGAPHASLKSQGRWKSDSSVERYTDNAKAAKETFARYLSHWFLYRVWHIWQAIKLCIVLVIYLSSQYFYLIDS